MDMFHGRIIDDISATTIDSTTTEYHESILGTDINDLEDDSGPHTNLYSGKAERAFGLLGNSIDTCTITAKQ